MNIYLDDKRTPVSDAWTVIRTPDDFKAYIRKYGLPDAISFDHDLGAEETGKDCAYWLCEWCIENDKPLDVVTLYTHSANPPGRKRIRSTLQMLLRLKEDTTQDVPFHKPEFEVEEQ